MNALTWLLLGSTVLGQTGDVDSEPKDLLYPFYAREAGRYDFFLDAEHKQRLELQKSPVLTWTNVDNYKGSVFVWTYSGRPEVVGCIGSQQFGNGQSNFFHEFHSLSLQPLQPVTLGDGPHRWTPSRPGVELNPVDGAPPPSDSDKLRLPQMRNIAREFSGAMKDNEDVTELRLLPQPIFRYQAPDRGVVDGAIFAFVWKGTDPEVLLMLEDRAAKSESLWNYALARFNYREMWVKHKDRKIWRVEVVREADEYITRNTGLRSQDEIRATALPSQGPPGAGNRKAPE